MCCTLHCSGSKTQAALYLAPVPVDFDDNSVLTYLSYLNDLLVGMPGNLKSLTHDYTELSGVKCCAQLKLFPPK